MNAPRPGRWLPVAVAVQAAVTVATTTTTDGFIRAALAVQVVFVAVTAFIAGVLAERYPPPQRPGPAAPTCLLCGRILPRRRWWAPDLGPLCQGRDEPLCRVLSAQRWPNP